MISSAVTSRSFRGFSRMMKRPTLSPTTPPVPCPAVDITASTFGIAAG